MKLNWFPGHMTKALREMQAEMKTIDFAIYVLDSRAPLSCVNPKFQKVIGEKPILYIINKIDLGDPSEILRFQKIFETNSTKCLALNCTQSGIIKQIDKCAQILCSSKIEKNKNRGINSVLRAIVLGVPNSGKSTLVNNLCNIARANTGNKPGVTRGKQWVKVAPDFEVLDTPGTLWPSFSEESQGENLALIGSIKDEVIDINELAICLIEKLSSKYSEALSKRYEVELIGLNSLETFEKIAQKKKLMIRGGEIDYERTARMLVDDFRKGRLGRICLEKNNA